MRYQQRRAGRKPVKTVGHKAEMDAALKRACEKKGVVNENWRRGSIHFGRRAQNG